MPYEWQEQTDGTHLLLWPHRSLSRRGFALFILITFAMLTLPLFAVLGTVVLWGLLPFLLIALAGVWWGLEKSYHTARVCEELVIDAQDAHLTRTNPNGEVLEWQCNRYWVRVEMHAKGGPVPQYITLSGSDRVVEIGGFLSEQERLMLCPEIIAALRSGDAG